MRISRFSVTLLFFLVTLAVSGQVYEMHLKPYYYGGPEQDPRISRSKDFISGHGYYVDMADSLADGKYIVYTDSTHSVIYLEAFFAGRQRTGTWTYYYENGIARWKIPYRNGLIDGNVLVRSYSGIMTMSMAFRAGKREGVSTSYAISYLERWKEQLVPASLAYFVNDTIVKYERFDRSGARTELGECMHGKPIHQLYFTPTGDTIREEFYPPSPRGKVTRKPGDTNNAAVYELVLRLDRKEELQRLDSLAKYVNLRSLTISDYSRDRPVRLFISDSLLNVKLQALRNLPLLEKLELYCIVPPVVYELKQVRDLVMYCPGPIDPRLTKMKRLERLWIMGTCSGKDSTAYPLPAGFASLTNLRELSITEYRVQSPGTELKKIATLKNLHSLGLANCGLNEFPLVLTQMTWLKELRIGGSYESKCTNKFDSLPEAFFGMKALQWVTLPEYYYYGDHEGKLKRYRARLPLCQFHIYYSCFTEKTRVTMADGSSTPITQLKPGDRILCYDLVENRLDTGTVTGTHRHYTTWQSLLVLETGEGEPLEVTPNHPVYKGSGFVSAELLGAGDLLTTVSRGITGTATARAIRPELRMLTPVYNISTTKGTYFANGILVHNK